MKNRLNYLRFIDTPAEGGGSQDDPEQPKTEPGDDAEDKKQDEPLGEGGLKALKAEREANKAAKAKIAEYETKIKAFEDRDKTEAEKTAEKLSQLEKDSQTSAAKALRLEVALDKGLPKALATRLQGSTKEELESDADTLLSLVKTDSKTIPKPDRSQGKGGAPKPTTLESAIAGHLK